MTNLRPIEDKYFIEKEHWVGSAFRVRNYFPEGRDLLERFSPFALMDYNAPMKHPPSKTPKGIGPHPHRGIETLTFALKGAVEHHDNAGNHGIIYPGDVQWMTAGSGIMHREYLEEDFQKKGGSFHMIQIWVSLPMKDKLTTPKYQDIKKEDMGKVPLPNGSGSITVVAGCFNGTKGPAFTFSPMNIYMANLKTGSNLVLQEPGDYNTGILVLSGDLDINSSKAKENDFILFENKEGIIEIDNTKSDSQFLVLSGEPLNEPVVAGGPFVMNTKEELRQASLDFREGRFGPKDF